MNDRELLELAAKAAEYDVRSDAWACVAGGVEPSLYIGNNGHKWAPLTDDGDALRLAVKLKLLVDTDHCCAMPIAKSGENPDDWSDGQLEDDSYAATRRAIVRAAAEIAKMDGK